MISNQTNSILALIAKNTLGIDTLETRNSDSLDFHDVAVWTIKEALLAAFMAGCEAGLSVPPATKNDSAEEH